MTVPYPPPDNGFLTPEDCRIRVKALHIAIDRLRCMGITLGTGNRLVAEAGALDRVVRSGRFPSEPNEQRLVAHALMDATDFVQVSNFVPNDFSNHYLHELRIATRGEAGHPRVKAEPFRFQSQFFVAALLHASGHPPKFREGAGPEYCIEVGVSEYGVEVKRPESEPSAIGAVRTAAKQLRNQTLEGVIVIDCTEAVPSGLDCIADAGSAIEAGNIYRERMDRLRVQLIDVVLDRRTQRIRKGCESGLGSLQSWILMDRQE